MARLIIRVKEIKGQCAVHSLGDRIVIHGPEIDLKTTDKICIHALPSLLHYAVALREGIEPEKLGLSKEGNKAYIHCPDPGEPYTDGGEVVFEVEMVED
ncbi:MAG: TIGR04076 family protein [Methanomassiliicoccales archaeon]|nr:MAG: TIGR04076 family protein [Methanomassiliicoccales archaeon]